MIDLKENQQKPKVFNKLHFIKTQLNYILECQNKVGGIQEKPGSFIDPWNHIESCLALLSYNYINQSRLGLRWLIENQNNDGSWYTRYSLSNNFEKKYMHTQSHYAAYISILIWYDFFITGDINELKKSYPALKKALDFTLSCQSKEGVFYWAKTIHNQCDENVLLTANSNIYLSLLAAFLISKQLGTNEQLIYLDALKKHKLALLNYYEHFTNFDLDFSMDWFYPVLCGLLKHKQAKQHLEKFWDDFVEVKLGCVCRKNKPWVTFAESSELIMALCIAKQTYKAKRVFEWIVKMLDKDYLFWMGYEYKEKCFWPLEKPSWTSAAALLALKHINNPKQACFLQLINQSE